MHPVKISSFKKMPLLTREIQFLSEEKFLIDTKLTSFILNCHINGAGRIIAIFILLLVRLGERAIGGGEKRNISDQN